MYWLWRKKIKAEGSNSTVKLQGFCLFSISFKEITQKLFQICLTPWKKKLIPSNHAASNCMKSSLIIDYLLKVSSSNVKTMLGRDINNLFVRANLFSYSCSWQKDLLKSFWISLFNKWKIWWMLSFFEKQHVAVHRF